MNSNLLLPFPASHNNNELGGREGAWAGQATSASLDIYLGLSLGRLVARKSEEMHRSCRVLARCECPRTKRRHVTEVLGDVNGLGLAADQKHGFQDDRYYRDGPARSGPAAARRRATRRAESSYYVRSKGGWP